jgi:hypothetical protein
VGVGAIKAKTMKAWASSYIFLLLLKVLAYSNGIGKSDLVGRTCHQIISVADNVKVKKMVVVKTI